MAQIIYDATFFAKYPALDRSVKGLDGAPEWPRLRELPPSLRGNVIGLGCGIDNFQNMLTLARERTDDNNIHYKLVDLDSIAFKD
ncbi:putative squalene synthase [Fusarium oxysporum f. sp. albedinis]|nr:putative squalene synthase [Fusarium oxysporum f. sp. albedinis]